MANKKIITDELIEEKLFEKGISFDAEHEEALDHLQEYYEFELTDEFNKSPDFSIYEESTADGYEVWVATAGDGRNVCIGEDVHYYDNDLSEKLSEAITDYYQVIYVSDIESDYVHDAVANTYMDFVDDMIEEIKDELYEQGYEDEKEK